MLYAQGCGGKVGIFLLLKRGRVLLVSGNRAILRPSLYLDLYGEMGVSMRRNKPLFLSQSRYAALQTLYLQHEIPKEVSRARASLREVIRDGWY